MTIPSLTNKQSGSVLMIGVVVLVLAVIAGAGAYVATGGFKKDNNPSQNNQRTNDNPSFKVTTATTPADIKSLLTAVKAGDYDAKCTLKYHTTTTSANVLNATGPATLYLSGAVKLRLDATFVSSAGSKPGHFMRLGNNVYLWSDGGKEGSIIPITDKSSSTSAASTDKFVQEADKYDMKCQSVAKLDDSLFVLPTGVHFVDLNSKLNSSSSGN